VDDEPDITTVLSAGLDKHGFNVTAYTDPVQALLQFEADKFDVVLLDYKMNALDGFALYEKLKAIDSKPQYCFLSATEYIPKIGEMAKPILTETRFMHKPIAIKNLIEEIEKMLS